VRARARDSEREKGRKSALAREREKEREIERETGLTELVAETGVATADIKDAPCLAHARLSQGS
jgi:general stress protein YciG